MCAAPQTSSAPLRAPYPPSASIHGEDLRWYLVNNASLSVIRKNNRRYVCCERCAERGTQRKEKKEEPRGPTTTVTTRERSRTF